ncbi:MAG: L-ascorbate metabolism protein UlaG (beta-lactamase superfamily) [Myxococcota bacterium]|jgi:L-ascorbate metabolism protein UlaG (beta-lactamase superfamily)
MIRTLATPDSQPEAHRVYFEAHHRDSGFFNPWRDVGVSSPRDLLRWKLSRSPFAAEKKRRPELSLVSDPLRRLSALPEDCRVMWLGHASVMVQIDGITVLIDPVFGRAGGLMRREVAAPLRPEDLPRIDAVMLTHGHMDHLDVASLRAIGRRFGEEVRFITPLGLSATLPGECVSRTELDWWQGVEIGGVTLGLVPAQHWHRRGLSDTNRALWGGAILSGSRTIFHSGDTGYFGGFSAIGEAFDIDLAILPMGAYEPRWFMSAQHMAPEDSVQTLLDLNARHAMAMHWGTFDLTDEPLNHGISTLLPSILSERGLEPSRFVVLQHGDSLGVTGGDLLRT